ncbi:hypothetical protein BB560_003985, partial [Smittium megazygosporum]
MKFLLPSVLLFSYGTFAVSGNAIPAEDDGTKAIDLGSIGDKIKNVIGGIKDKIGDLKDQGRGGHGGSSGHRGSRGGYDMVDTGTGMVTVTTNLLAQFHTDQDSTGANVSNIYTSTKMTSEDSGIPILSLEEDGTLMLSSELPGLNVSTMLGGLPWILITAAFAKSLN